MKVLLSIFIIFSLQMAHACKLKSNIVSLSNPITTLLEELELLHSGGVKAISSFHKTIKPFKGEILAGGIFLSKSKLQDLGESVIFFDASKEFEDSLKHSQVKKFVKIETIGLGPFKAVDLLISKLLPYTKDCGEKVKQLNVKLDKTKINISKKLKNKVSKIIFFLGSCSDKLPELVVVNDGFVKFLNDEKLIETYPSKLSYVTWSKKILNQLNGFQYFCIDTKSEKYQLKFEKKDQVNISYGDAFNPGLSQVYFLEKLITLF